MTLIQRNAQQLREIALQNSKKSEENNIYFRYLYRLKLNVFFFE